MEEVRPERKGEYFCLSAFKHPAALARTITWPFGKDTPPSLESSLVYMIGTFMGGTMPRRGNALRELNLLIRLNSDCVQ